MKRHRVGKGRRHPIRIVKSWDAALDILDGKKWVDDEGIEGVFKVDRSRKYDTRVMHIKTPKGRATEAYQKQKREYHDDWDTDMTGSEELPTIAHDVFGVRWSGRDPKTGGYSVQRGSGSFRRMPPGVEGRGRG